MRYATSYQHCTPPDEPEEQLHECENCGAIEAAPGEPECALCVEAAAMAYRREHDSGAER